MGKLMRTMLVALFSILLVFSVSACGTETTKTIEITAQNETTSVYVGGSLQFNAKVTPEGKDVVEWSVSGLQGCAVSQTGLFTAGDVAGTAVVKAQIQGTDVSATYPLTVLAMEQLQVAESPEAITLTYGDPLSDDLLTGGLVKSGETAVDGMFSFAGNTQILGVGTHSVSVSFIPDDEKYASVSTTVSISVEKMAITVRALNKNMEWGGAEPQLNYTVVSGSLVGDDQPTGALERESGTDVGTYGINQGTLNFGDNYDVLFIAGSFEIKKATAQITIDDLQKTYNGKLQTPAITISPVVDYAMSFNGLTATGVKAAGTYEVVVSVDTENTSGSATATFVIEKLSVALTAEGMVQAYNPAGNAVTIVSRPVVDDLIITYKNSTYESTTAPSEAGEYEVIVSQPEYNYSFDNTRFSLKITPTGYFCDDVKLFAREMGTTPLYDLSEIGTSVRKIIVSGKQLDATEYRISGNTLSLASTAFSNSVGTSATISLYVGDGLYVTDVYVTDYIIDESNWRDFLTNGAKNTLAANNATRLSKSYLLATDIVYGEEDYFLGVGRASVSSSVGIFTGYFDGNGHTISNWTSREKVNTTVKDVLVAGNNSGFFGVHSGTVCNLGFVNITIKLHGTKSGNYFVGGIAGALMGGKIRNCYVKGATLHAYSDDGASDPSTDNSCVGAIFAVTGNASETDPSVVENVLVYGDVTLVTRQAKWIRGAGQASRTTGRNLVMTNVYVTDNIKAYTREDETLIDTLPVIVDSLGQVKQTNVAYKKTDEMKVAKTDDGIYADFEGCWVFESGSYPAFAEVYQSTVGGDIFIDGLRITNTETNIYAGEELQIRYSYDFSNGLAAPAFQLVEAVSGVSLSSTGYLTTSLAVPHQTVLKIKVVVNGIESEVYELTVKTPRQITVEAPAAATTIPQGESAEVRLSLTETVDSESAITYELQLFRGEDFVDVDSIDGVVITKDSIHIGDLAAVGTVFKVRFVATDSVGSVKTDWIIVTVSEALDVVVVTNVVYAQDQEGYNQVTYKLERGSEITSVAAVNGESNTVLDATQVTVNGREISFASDYLATLANGDYRFVASLSDESTVELTLKKGDVIIGAENWKEYLTNTGSNTLANTDATRLASYYILDTDIDFTNYNFFGIGRKSLSVGPGTFKGVFDGNGHTISNWRPRASVSNDVITVGNTGFIGVHSGTIRNLGFINTKIVAHGSNNTFVGVIAGALASGKIYNCYIYNAMVSATSTLAEDKSLAGFIFASTGSAKQDNPSVIENVLVFGELSITVGKAGYQRAIGTASSTVGRYLTVTNVYVAEGFEAKLADESAITSSTLLVDSRTQVTTTNAQYLSNEQFKVAKSADNVYANFSDEIWSFVEGEYPALVK